MELVAAASPAPDEAGLVRQTLQGYLARTLKPLCWALAGFYAFLAVYGFLAPADAAVSLRIAWTGSSLAFLAAALVLRRTPVPANRAHAFAAAIAAVVVSDGALLVYATGLASLTEALAITVVGFALLLFSEALTFGIVVAALAGWALAAGHAGWTRPWIPQGIGLVGASVVALVVQRMRVRAYSRIERLRRREVAHLAQEEELKRLREMDGFKGRLLNMVAHELATPITPLRLQLANIRAAQGDEGAQRRLQALETMERNLLRLSNVMEDVVLAARGKIAPAVLRRQEIDLAALLGERAMHWEPVAAARNARIQPILESATVRGDRILMERAIDKLVDNAVKFSRPGGRIEIALRGGPAGTAEVRVADSGPGIPPDRVKAMFEPLTQGHDTMQRTDSGIGLGLRVAHLVAEAHGGSLHHEPNPGGGSVFVLRLPIAA